MPSTAWRTETSTKPRGGGSSGHPSWLGEALQNLRPPERMTVTQWADRHRVLDERTSAQPGPWRTSLTPYLQGIMDAFTDPDVEELWLCKPTQVGGTEAILNMLAYAIAQDPAPTLIVYPTLELARWTSVNRIQPMIDLCPELKARYQLRASTDLELQFTGMYLCLAGANSPASLATRPIRYLFLDEVDKYPAGAGSEADPIALAQERTKTFVYNRKIVGTSTPTFKSGHIWRHYESAGEIRQFFVPCPHCGHYQPLTFRPGLRWPEGAGPEDAGDLAWYECEACKGRIADQHKPVMLRTGQWRSTGGRGAGGRIVACHLNTLASPWVRFGEVASKFLRVKEDPEELRNFVNSWLGEPWETASAKMDGDLVLERQTEVPEGVVPEEAVLLTGGVDVQEDRLYWTVRGWGPRLTSWGIAHGEALGWADIEQVMNRQWEREGGGPPAIVNLVGVDSGDQTDDVYAFCALNSDWAKPVKGASQPLLSRYRITRVDRPTSSAHGMQLVLVDGDQYKSMIAGRMNRPNGRGSWMVHAGCDREYAEQVTAEHCVEEVRGGQVRRVWRRKSTSAANHYLDAEVYAAVAADLLQVRYLDDDATATSPAPRGPAPPGPQRGPGLRREEQDDLGRGRSGGWLRGKRAGGWI